ncbi:MAG: hypothetical protein M3Q75_15495, partial [Gemmatimonadota bacterium]|nr:hypothetical protein [Gemmatimonadota bacterium]
MDPNVFETANAGFAQAMYEEFLRDPAAVGPEWRRLFESGVVGERGSGADGQRSSQSTPATSEESAPGVTVPPTAPQPSGPAAKPIKGPAAKLVANMN